MSLMKGINMTLKFYMIDTESEKYFVSKLERSENEVIPELSQLEIGETYWTGPTTGFERFE